MAERARVYFESVEPVCDDVAPTSVLITCYDTFIKWLIISVFHPLYIVYHMKRTPHTKRARYKKRTFSYTITQLQGIHLQECEKRKM